MTTVNNATENELWGPQRSRTVTWHDPGPGMRAAWPWPGSTISRR